jgi:predicted lipoprotein with Yx(FWY)xxD motif
MDDKSIFLSGKKAIAWLGASLLFVLVLAACAGPAAPAQTSAPAETQAPAVTEATTEATIKVASDPKLGNILVDGSGMTLYIFTKDDPNKVNCSGKCIDNWPPLLTQGHPNLGDGVDASMIGSAPLPDGTMIVTYDHRPLYYFIKDKQAGDIVGQGNNDVWYVVAPDGTPVGYQAPGG